MSSYMPISRIEPKVLIPGAKQFLIAFRKLFFFFLNSYEARGKKTTTKKKKKKKKTTYSEWLKYILVYSCKHRSTSFLHVEDVLR